MGMTYHAIAPFLQERLYLGVLFVEAALRGAGTPGGPVKKHIGAQVTGTAQLMVKEK